MELTGTTVLVTGANRGLGRQLLDALLEAIRPGPATRGISVHGVYPAGIDTDMIVDIEGPRTPPRQVADGILARLERGEEDIFPHPISQSPSPTWFSDPKAYERAFSGR